MKKKKILRKILYFSVLPYLFSMGTGFLIKGTGEFSYEGVDYDVMKEKISWMRAVLKIKPYEINQTL